MPLVATIGLALTFALALTLPVALFVVAPLLFGVPHVASDVRYLILRRDDRGRLLRLMAVGSAAMLGLRAAEELGLLPPARAASYEICVGAAWAAAAATMASAGRRDAAKRWQRVLIGVCALGTAAYISPLTWRLVFAHLHNWVGVGLWAYLFHRTWKTALLPLGLLALMCGVLLSGAGLPLAFRLHGEHAFGLHFFVLSDWYAPGLPPSLSQGLTHAYVFMQSVHYAVWLGWIPQEDTRAQGTPTFRMSLRSLRQDFGRWGLVTVVVATLALLAVGAFLPRPSRDLYVSLATFHGYLELAALAYVLTVGRWERSSPSEARAGGRPA